MVDHCMLLLLMDNTLSKRLAVIGCLSSTVLTAFLESHTCLS